MNTWVVTHDTAVATDLIAGARALASSVNAISLGAEAAPGADLTLVAPAPAADELLEGYAAAIAEELTARQAQVVLFGADIQSRLLAGLVASRLQTSVRNITGAAPDWATITRTVYGGLAVATDAIGAATVVLVVGPGALGEASAPGVLGEVKAWAAASASPGLQVVETRSKTQQVVNLAAAKRVVGVGRGFGAEADLGLARDLGAKLDAEVACSRPIAEGEHWLPVERYLGVSGAVIRPDLYLAVGISGQVQHLVGINRSKVIVAINKDKNAPIFAAADYGIVGDLYEVLPALIAAL
ncbi:MAG: FAD-binding protein [Propionibacteriaceae bacterium]|jgi:electron transfer flavoprotein alpha subunit|nr:FAD-binding protein [Propionibacteriaceae bacterium]